MTDRVFTHISNNLDLFVLRFIEDVGVVEDLHERRPCFNVSVEELDELLELCASFLKVLGILFASGLICNKDTCALKARLEDTDGGWDGRRVERKGENRHLSASSGSRDCRCRSSWLPAVSPSGPPPPETSCIWRVYPPVSGAEAKTLLIHLLLRYKLNAQVYLIYIFAEL